MISEDLQNLYWVMLDKRNSIESIEMIKIPHRNQYEFLIYYDHYGNSFGIRHGDFVVRLK